MEYKIFIKVSNEFEVGDENLPSNWDEMSGCEQQAWGEKWWKDNQALIMISDFEDIEVEF